MISPLVVACSAIALSLLATQIAFPDGILIGPFHVMPDDAVLFGLGAAGALGLACRRKLAPVELTFVCILALSALEFIISIPHNGTQAFLEFRNDALALATMLFLLEYEPHISRGNMAAGLAVLTVAAVILFGGRFAGLVQLPAIAESGDPLSIASYRFSNAMEALSAGFLLAAMVSIGTNPGKFGKPWLWWGAAALTFVFLFASLQRTVIIAAFASLGVLALLLIRNRLMSRRYRIAFVVGVPILAVGTVLAFELSPVLQLLVFSEEGRNSTFNWRVVGWMALLNVMQVSDFVLGKGFGANMGRWTVNGYVNVQAHDLFVEKLWQLGVAGLALYLMLFVQMFESLMRVVRRSRDREERLMAILLLAQLAASLVFAISYSLEPASYITYGCILSFCRSVAVKYPNNLKVFQARMRMAKARQQG